MNWTDSQAGTIEFDGVVGVFDDDGNMIDVYKKEDSPPKKEDIKPDEVWIKVVKKK